ncbi:hypothetical protein [Subtercola vilae]|uniref:hypothetical protein n=1 Tax=Subtercola vilae TaxID=2056433 RepID=UPI003B83215B
MADKKYEFTGIEKVNAWGYTVKQIRATEDIPYSSIRKGDLGGWIEGEQLKSGDARVSGNAWVFGDAQVFGNARVSGNAQVFGNARVSGDARVSGNARVSGDAQVSGDARVSGNARVSGDAWVVGDAQVFGDARVSGNARVVGDAWVFGDARVFGNARVSGDAQVFGNAQVSGDARVESREHYIIVGPIGSEGVTATLFRTKNGKHTLNVGCWSGTLGTLSAEVKLRRESWVADDSTKDRWTAQYKALKSLGKATVTAWETPEAIS